MTDYYARKLAGRRLQEVYALAAPRVRQYLEAEIQHVLRRLPPGSTVLELGCGYGRVAFRLAEVAGRVVGIDNAAENLELARELARHLGATGDRCEFVLMGAEELHFPEGSFDAVVCLQNGVCAFGIDQASLLRDSLRLARPGGIVLFSTYADRFWPHRLAWFEAQAAAGLLGPLDRAASRDGVIVCQDGFRSGHLTPADWRRLCRRIGAVAALTEVDSSSLFCELTRAR
jgi:SAM-dependent methyltransferase